MAAIINPPVATPPPITGFTTIWGVTINPSVIALAVGMVGLGWLIYQAQKSAKPFDLRDLVRGADEKLDLIKATFVGTWIVTSWAIVDLEIKARLTDTLFGAYLLAWVGPLTAKVIFNKSDVSLPIGRKEKTDGA